MVVREEEAGCPCRDVDGLTLKEYGISVRAKKISKGYLVSYLTARLVHERGAYMRSPNDASSRRGKVAKECSDEGRLATTIRTDNGES
jgi:hypothetical protein